MMNIQFTKMHGAGNDYIYINGFTHKIDNPSKLAVTLSNRNFGIGSDGLVLILPSLSCDFRMQMFNPDGSEAEMCGNASRCVGKWVHDKGLTIKRNISLETKAGIKEIILLEGNSKTRKVKVDMGEPILQPSLIPINIKKGKMVLNHPLQLDGREWNITAVSMGNPHAVVFTMDIENLPLPVLGPQFETNKLFPHKTNTEFIEVIDRHQLNMRVWERGTGETLACGTGACAATVAAVLNDYCDRKVTVHLQGGDLEVEWNKANNHVYMTGDAVTVFDGVLLWIDKK